jgi:hypothetical protein
VSVTGKLLVTHTQFTVALFVYHTVVLFLLHIYSKYSPGSNILFVWFPNHHIVKLDQVEGYVPGSVTLHAQFGATASVNTIFFKLSVKLFVTLILNIAQLDILTV